MDTKRQTGIKLLSWKFYRKHPKRSRNTKRSLGFAATTKASGRRRNPTPPRRTLEETLSLHHCKIQESTIANEALWVDEQARCTHQGTCRCDKSSGGRPHFVWLLYYRWLACWCSVAILLKLYLCCTVVCYLIVWWDIQYYMCVAAFLEKCNIVDLLLCLLNHVMSLVIILL